MAQRKKQQPHDLGYQPERNISGITHEKNSRHILRQSKFQSNYVTRNNPSLDSRTLG